jgi:hypothetical protein
MKSFRTIIAAIAIVALTQVQAETPALRRLDGTETAPENPPLDGSQAGGNARWRWCNRWPFYCSEY